MAERILASLRVPDLPYAVGRSRVGADDWRNLLLQAWTAQSSKSVVDHLREQVIDWPIRQVNAAFLADRMMDVFLRKSGLHPQLVEKAARMRFWLAFRLDAEGEAALTEHAGMVRWGLWLDHLQGWSASTGRSSRSVIEQLDLLFEQICRGFNAPGTDSLLELVNQLLLDLEQQGERVVRLEQRLLNTEQGAARQRAADQHARTMVGRALQGRHLPRVVQSFIHGRWLSLLKQIVLDQGLSSEVWRHAVRVLEWLVWATSPGLSDQDTEKLYRVGERLLDKAVEVWGKVMPQPIPDGEIQALQEILIARLRGMALEWVPVGPQDMSGNAWSEPEPAILARLTAWVGHWFVEGEGKLEQRRFLFAYLESVDEVLWTNGSGVKLGLMPARQLILDIDAGLLRLLPAPIGFQYILADTVNSLGKVLESQERQRQQAAESARIQVEALRLARERAENEAAEALAKRQSVELELQQQLAEQAEASAVKAAEDVALRHAEAGRLALQEQESRARQEVDELKLGGWIEWCTEQGEMLRLKLAIRINASGKLIFVDRFGLNKTELTVTTLVAGILAQRGRVVRAGVEFEDALSRVVSRIRIGK